MQLHRDGAASADGVLHRTEVVSIVRASVLIRRTGRTDRTERAGHDTLRILRTNLYRCWNLNRLACPREVGQLIQVMQCGLLIGRAGAGGNLSKLQEIIVQRAVVVGICRGRSANRVRACRALTDLRLVLRNIQAGGVGYVEDIEGVLEADPFLDLDRKSVV